ncbi:MAG: flagellar hook-associated protein FlgK [Planctomycetes bacterium]|nr:flagellar hook-associated protein FlgK [Planctomycetota bacterium]
MQNFAIGLSGLNAAQAALEIVGNNVANAATEGYHRQRIELTPAAYGEIPAGVDVAGVTRMVDTLLEGEILRQESAYGQVSQELSFLSTVEATLGEFSDSGGLNATMDTFFDSLRALAAHPLEQVPRTDVISTAQALTGEFRRLGASLASLADQVTLEAQNTVDSINLLVSQIAELNGKIQAAEIGPGLGEANNLRDQRDRMIADLAKLVGIETIPRENGVVDVAVAGIPVVTGAMVVDLRLDVSSDESLVVSADGAAKSSLEVEGGRLGGLLSLKNGLLKDIRTDLDTLARAVVNAVNQVHAQGLGPEGSFRELIGWPLGTAGLADLQSPVTDGTFYIRVTNTATGESQRYAVDVDVSGPTPDTPASIADRISALDGLKASITSSKLYIAAEAGYTFDFSPAVLAEPIMQNFTAVSPPPVSVSGLYTGQENHVFTFTVAGSGSVGNGALQLSVADEDGEMVGTLNIGTGYAAGEAIALDSGLKIAVGMGDLNAGDSFQVQALATTDTSGFLTAAGMNAFFSGDSAGNMQVCREILDAPDRIAAAFGRDLTDNLGALRLAAVRDEMGRDLAGMTPGEYYQRIVADLGQQVALKEARQENVEAVRQNLLQQRDDLSAVNINDEAAQMLLLQQMFQAVAKYLSSLQTTMTALMDVM